MGSKTKFQSLGAKLVARLTPENCSAFQALEDDQARVKFLYPLSEDAAGIELATWQPKDYERAESLKTTGNTLFQQHSLYHAIHVYNEGLFRCPQDDLKSQRLYAILVANRSAVFFEQRKYEKVLKDIEFLEVYGQHPAPHKLHMRAAKACEALRRHSKAAEYYRKALADMDPKDLGKMADIEAKIKAMISKQDSTAFEHPNMEELSWCRRNLTYPALSPKVAVRNDLEHGRFVVAKEDIVAGEIIAMEAPYVCVLNGEMYRTNCAYCTLSIDQLIVCETCCEACYCDLECKQRAAVYHQFECLILLTLYDAGVSVNCLMALRLVTQRNLVQLRADEAYAAAERNVVIYKTEDYYNVARLVSHTAERHVDELIHYTFMACYFLRLLKTTKYFPAPAAGVLTDDEAFVGGLILRYLQQLQYNAHEIAELQNDSGGGRPAADVEQDVNYRTGTVGAGLYPTLALFNHSCDPTVIRYNIGNTMVLRTVKAVKYGDGIYENYGPLYTAESKVERQDKMRNLYRFECRCQACVEDWPVFRDIDVNIMRVACECGGVIPTHRDVQVPTLTCPRCNRSKNLLPVLTGLMPMEMKSNNAEELFVQGAYDAAANVYAALLGAYVKYLAPPFTDLVLMQQRLKTCLLHRGNKKFGYLPPNASKF